jgi:outer membrane protein OmpA-like peptidoglycan-associated protein
MPTPRTLRRGFPERIGLVALALVPCTWIVAACNESDGAEAQVRADGSVALPPMEASPQFPDAAAPAPAQPLVYTADTVLHHAAVGGPVGARIGAAMDGEATELRATLEGLEVERMGEGIKITLDVGVPFEEGSDELAPETMDYLTRLAERLAAFTGANVVILGHTDRTGNPEANLRLSEQRALSALAYLATEGIDRSRMVHLGLGEREPVVFEDGDPNARRVNRRMEIVIVASDGMKASLDSTGGEP